MHALPAFCLRYAAVATESPGEFTSTLRRPAPLAESVRRALCDTRAGAVQAVRVRKGVRNEQRQYSRMRAARRERAAVRLRARHARRT